MKKLTIFYNQSEKINGGKNGEFKRNYVFYITSNYFRN